jgi:hypothetical protein
MVPADGAILQRILPTLPTGRRHGLSGSALVSFETAQARTPWGLVHRRRVALLEGDVVRASAECYDLTGRLDAQPVRICGMAVVGHGDADQDDGTSAAALIEQIADQATRDGADLALLFRSADSPARVPMGFEAVPITDVTVTVVESARRGAPMTLVRGGEDRDLDAIAAMGGVRAGPFRFHLERDAAFIKHAITRKRLLAGLGSAGARQLEFVIAEEGITAAAYVVISITAGAWVIEECGDRDPSGARVGAILQALIAREPVEARPVIGAWLPPGFLPPQVVVTPAVSASPRLLARALSLRGHVARCSAPDVMYWLNDVF